MFDIYIELIREVEYIPNDIEHFQVGFYVVLEAFDIHIFFWAHSSNNLALFSWNLSLPSNNLALYNWNLALFTRLHLPKMNDPDHLERLRHSFTEVLRKGEEGTPFNQEDERHIVLLSLIEASKLLSIVYPNDKEARATQKQLKHVNKNLPVSKAVKETIHAIDVAIIAAIAVTTTSSNQSNS